MLEFSLRMVGLWLLSASGLRSSKRNSPQHHDLVLLDGRHKRDQVSTESTISSALDEVL